jgi:hypothetical protein
MIRFAWLVFALGAHAAPVLTQQGQGLYAKGNNPFFSAKANTTQSAFKCGVTMQAHSGSDKYELCPTECPYFTQNREDSLHCTFLCVPGDQCAKWNPNKPIADSLKGTRTCRGPRVNYCDEQNMDGTDSCKVCQSGFEVHEDDGGCYFAYWNTLLICMFVIVALVVVIASWVIDMCCRENVNPEVLNSMMVWRSRSKNLAPKEEGKKRQVYPWNTNMCKTDVAGPGMTLHFRFQVYLIAWALVIAVTWTILACFHNELFILGTRRFGTPRQNCILVAWGYETQNRLMWTKVLFLAIAYLFTFVSSLVFAVSQLKIFNYMDANDKTYKDFALELSGLPELPADSPNAEAAIKAAVEKQAQTSIVGVSVAWNYTDVEDKVVYLLTPKVPDPVDPPEMDGLHQWMFEKEKGLLGPDPDPEVDAKTLLSEMKSSSTAYAVFKTEKERNHAFSKLRGIMFDPSTASPDEKSEEIILTVNKVYCEPAAINWNYFGDDSPAAMWNRFVFNFCTLYLGALAVWFFFFYVPYAISLYNFNYDNGAVLPSYYGIVFTMVVVGGNATMYIICDLVAENIQFRYKDTKQVVYVLFYLFACTVNVLLDMVVTYFTARKVMIGLDFRTYDGRLLSAIDSFTEQFETYAMQRTLAENTYAYAFPSTFLIPFLLEPFVTIIVPLHVGRLIVRTHPEITGRCAEAYMAAFDFDLGRYADLLLNVFLGILIFYFPGGYTWSLFYGMFISHIIIYAFDHWRVLNVIPNIKIVSNEVDWWSQLMMIPCNGLILSCLVFKMNCEPYAGYCIQDMELIYSTSLAFVVHCIVHYFLFAYLVPVLAGTEKDNDLETPYEVCASRDAHGWFSVNPVHCLRSQYILEDKPEYSRYCSVGKEHLLKKNEKIGVYFQDDAAATEESGAQEISDMRRAMTRKLTAATGRDCSGCCGGVGDED